MIVTICSMDLQRSIVEFFKIYRGTIWNDLRK